MDNHESKLSSVKAPLHRRIAENLSNQVSSLIESAKDGMVSSDEVLGMKTKLDELLGEKKREQKAKEDAEAARKQAELDAAAKNGDVESLHDVVHGGLLVFPGEEQLCRRRDDLLAPHIGLFDGSHCAFL